MPSSLDRFESIARSLARLPRKEPVTEPVREILPTHPFESRNVHPNLPTKVRELFDDGRLAEATFHAFKFLDKEVERHSGISETGWKLMMAALDDNGPVNLTPMVSETEKNEQQGFDSSSPGVFERFGTRVVMSTLSWIVQTLASITCVSCRCSSPFGSCWVQIAPGTTSVWRVVHRSSNTGSMYTLSSESAKDSICVFSLGRHSREVGTPHQCFTLGQSSEADCPLC